MKCKDYMLSNRQGVCPSCNSVDLEYGAVVFEGEECYFPFECEHCGQVGEEWYDLSFVGHNVITEEGDTVEVETILKKEDEENG